MSEMKNKLLKPYGELYDIRETVTDEKLKQNLSKVISQLAFCISLVDDKIPVKNSRRVIKQAVDGGWEVTSSDANKALDMWVEYVGENNALEDLAQATGDDNLKEDIEWIARQFGVAEELEQYDSVWDKHNELCSLIGVHEYFENLWRAMGSDELAACLAFIFRQNDFQKWDDQNGIYSSKGLKNKSNLHKLYS